MQKIKFYSGANIPLEMHRAKVVQKISLVDIDSRERYLNEARFNSYLLKNEGVFLDMLTDSGMAAITDSQLSASMLADDAYAGSRTYYELEDKIKEIFGFDFFLPVHQGRACEYLLAKAFVKEGDIVPMNYYFSTTKTHIMRCGGMVAVMNLDYALDRNNLSPFKGNMDLDKLEKFITQTGAENIPFVRLEAGTNLIGGQPLSLQNMKDVNKICKKHGILTLLDASLLQDNLYFIKTREEACANMSIKEITKAISDEMDIIYFSARKLGFAKGGGICTRTRELYNKLKELVSIHEGFLTYGGIPITELAAMTQGLDETMDFDMISQGPQFIAYMVDELDKRGIPVVKPAGGLGCHIDAGEFLDHLKPSDFPAAALTAAIYLAGGIRSMENGTMGADIDPESGEKHSDLELVRLAMPRRLYTRSHVDFAVDRIQWLYENRRLVGGLKFVDESSNLLFISELYPSSDWCKDLIQKYKEDFGDSL